MDSVRFGLIGCGKIAVKHAEALAHLPSARLMAVADKMPEAAASFGTTCRAWSFTDYRHLLEVREIDAVIISTPSGLHAQMAIDAAEAGKHVVVEKPLALTPEDCDRVIRTARKNKVKLACVHPNRYLPPVRRLREAIVSGKFGRLVYGSAAVRWNRGPQYYSEAPWRGTWAMDGGVLMNQAIHNIDLLQWMMGPVETVYANTATRLRPIEAEDTAVASIRFANGALGLIEATTTVYPRNLEETLSIFGERGTVILDGSAINGIRVWRVEGDVPEEEVLGQATRMEVRPGWMGHLEVLEDMVKAIRDNREPSVNGEEGRKAVALVAGAYESGRTGLPIKLGSSVDPLVAAVSESGIPKVAI